MAPRTEERHFKPYRRFLVVVFGILVFALCGMIIRGITRTLDRLPRAEHMTATVPLDARALRACAEDLRRLELKVRQTASLNFKETQNSKWRERAKGLELERITLVGRCGLQEPGEDSARQALARAASHIEDLLRTYTFLDNRFSDEGAPASRRVHTALKEAETALRP